MGFDMLERLTKAAGILCTLGGYVVSVDRQGKKWRPSHLMSFEKISQKICDSNFSHPRTILRVSDMNYDRR